MWIHKDFDDFPIKMTTGDGDDVPKDLFKDVTFYIVGDIPDSVSWWVVSAVCVSLSYKFHSSASVDQSVTQTIRILSAYVTVLVCLSLSLSHRLIFNQSDEYAHTCTHWLNSFWQFAGKWIDLCKDKMSDCGKCNPLHPTPTVKTLVVI